MDAHRWRLTRELFEAVADAAPAQWQAQLEQRCPGDAALRAEVLALLQADAVAARGVGMVEHAPALVVALAQQLAARGGSRAAQPLRAGVASAPAGAAAVSRDVLLPAPSAAKVAPVAMPTRPGRRRERSARFLRRYGRALGLGALLVVIAGIGLALVLPAG